MPILNAVSLLELLNKRIVYKVPKFQRDFSWDKEQIDRFWDDVIDLINREGEEYFLGSMIFNKITEKEVEIVDGQQRLATVTILLSCIRDFFEALHEPTEAERVEESYIGRRPIRGDERNREFKIQLNLLDGEYFLKNIQSRTATAPGYNRFGKQRGAPTSHKLIKKAHDIFKKNISEIISEKRSKDDRIDFLRQIEECLIERFKTFTIFVDQEEDAYCVFETLNERGLDLSIADLFKNHLYSNAGQKNLHSVEIEWNSIKNTISEGSQLNKFLRHYWLSKEDFVREKDLYKAFKTHLRHNKEVAKFVSDLKEEAENYQSFINPTEEFWGGRKQVLYLLRELRVLGAKQALPLLLSGRKKLDDKDFAKLVALCVKLTFRYSSCSLNPNKLEKRYSDLAIKFRSGKMMLGHVRGELFKINPSDKDFLSSLESMQIKSSNVARYILGKIEGSISEIFEEFDISEKKITLEHIMPQTPDDKWLQYIKKEGVEFGEFLNRLGNLTLLSGPRNATASNKLFRKKCDECYSKSKLKITNSICKYSTWNEDSINDRQKDLAKKALKIWAL